MYHHDQFSIPPDWLQIDTIDMHTGGEPLRIISKGWPSIPGSTVLSKRNFVAKHQDHLRKLIMWEPRGHADMYGCLITEPNDAEADFGVIFMHNAGYSTMCGHAVIALGKLAVELGWVPKTPPEAKVVIDAPCGRVSVWVALNESLQVESIRFHGVPSFVLAQDLTCKLDHTEINYHLAYGGAFYAYVEASEVGLRLIPENYNRLIRMGRMIKQAIIRDEVPIAHPFESDLSFLYGVIFIEQSDRGRLFSRNVCVFADGEVDRCPTGSGVSGRLPLHYAQGLLGINEEMVVESITGSTFKGSIEKVTQFGPYQAVIPEVKGKAFITGKHTFVLNPKDPFPTGFFLR